MAQSDDTLFVRLQAAVASWNAQAGQAHHTLIQNIAETRAKLNSAARILDVQRTLSPSLITARTEMEAMEMEPEERRRYVESSLAGMDEMRTNLDAFDGAIAALMASADNATRTGERLVARLLQMRGESSPAPLVVPVDLEAYETDEGRVPLPGPDEVAHQEHLADLREELSSVRERYADLKVSQDEALEAAQNEVTILRSQVAALSRDLEALRAAPPVDKPYMAKPEPMAPPEEERLPDRGVGEGHGRILASARDDQGRKRRMGDILVDAGVITQDQLDQALARKQERGNEHLGAILVRMGFSTHAIIAQALAAQAQIPFIHLAQSNIDARAIRQLSPQLVRRHLCVPFHVDPDTLSVAMANPLDLVALDDIQLAARRTVQPYAAAVDEIQEALRRYYGPR